MTLTLVCHVSRARRSIALAMMHRRPGTVPGEVFCATVPALRRTAPRAQSSLRRLRKLVCVALRAAPRPGHELVVRNSTLGRNLTMFSSNAARAARAIPASSSAGFLARVILVAAVLALSGLAGRQALAQTEPKETAK